MVKYSHILTFLWIFCIISLKWWCSSMGMANKIRVILIEKNMKIKDLAAGAVLICAIAAVLKRNCKKLLKR